MDHFIYKDGVLHAEGVPVSDIAKAVGTPCYIYSRATLERHAHIFRDALKPAGRVHVAYAVKANPNISVLKLLAGCGYGADVVSIGEMQRAMKAGIAAENIVFSGVGKTGKEIRAALDAGLGQFNIESEEEGHELAQIAAEMGKVAQVSLRVNPDVDAKTHAKISTGKAENKFGVGFDRADAIFVALSQYDSMNMRGLAVHIGSQLLSLDPLEAAFIRLGQLLSGLRAQGHVITHMDLGGGLGVPYHPNENPPSPAEYGAMVARVTKDWDVTLQFEPGRVIAGNAGILLSEVVRVKHGGKAPFVVVDAAMNDLARPALYDAYHDFVAEKPNGKRMIANIVGPVCETGDTFAMGRDIDVVEQGDLVAFRTAGAYGATMASSYNSRGLVPEVLVDGDQYAVVAKRIDAVSIMDAEPIPTWLK